MQLRSCCALPQGGYTNHKTFDPLTFRNTGSTAATCEISFRIVTIFLYKYLSRRVTDKRQRQTVRELNTNRKKTIKPRNTKLTLTLFTERGKTNIRKKRFYVQRASYTTYLPPDFCSSIPYINWRFSYFLTKYKI